MDKLKMHSINKVDENVEKIGALFPNCITESVDSEGKLQRSIDFDMLKQELSNVIVEGKDERYQFTWPDKKKAILTANAPISKTLRPCKEESVDFDKTENLYIEGDNLDVLKLLQETYLGKIKMIYIDPPYNTGNDFVYNDDFAESSEEYIAHSGQLDEEGNRLVKNLDSNGRFHTDWLNMIYPRLKLAKDLLSEDGVIFISIDDNEAENLKKICNEIFGENNCLGVVTWNKKRKGSFLSKNIISLTEYVLVYTKNINFCRGLFGGEAKENESQPIIKRTNKVSRLKIPSNTIVTKLKDGIYKTGVYGDKVNPVKLCNDVVVENGVIINEFYIEAPFVWSQDMFDKQKKSGAKFVINTLNFQIRVFKVYEQNDFKGFPSFISGIKINGTNEDAYEELLELFKVRGFFDYSKPINYIKKFIDATTHFTKDSYVLDFFSGSSTTAHAVMQLNAEDGGNRKFIMVQLPEETDEKSEAYKAGYKNICEIGKERIRRAGAKIKEENPLETQNLDTGFRVLKLDESNMKNVYYTPDALNQNLFDNLVDNIKEDRTPEDLLFQVMLDLGVLLSSKIETTEIDGKKVFNVENNYLIACFDDNVTEKTITEIAKMKPYYFVMRDSSMASDSVATNFDQIFATYSPETERKVL